LSRKKITTKTHHQLPHIVDLLVDVGKAPPFLFSPEQDSDHYDREHSLHASLFAPGGSAAALEPMLSGKSRATAGEPEAEAVGLRIQSPSGRAAFLRGLCALSAAA